MNLRTPSTGYLTDPRIKTLEALIHDRGVIGSKTQLSTLHYMAHRPVGGFVDEKQEKFALHVSRVVDRLSDDILILPKTGQDRLSTALVSRLRYPDANREFVDMYVAGLRSLGPKAVIGHALEKPIQDALRQCLPEEFIVTPTSTRQHHTSNDLVVRAPGSLTFNVELRNRRSHVHDTLAERDQSALERDQANGVVTVFVVPMSTIRFKNTVTRHGGLTIDTNMYVLPTEEQKMTWESYRCGGWETKTIPNAIPDIAQSIAETILNRLSSTTEVIRPNPTFEARTTSSTDATRPTPQDHVHRALDLYRRGTKTQYEAAEIMGIEPSVLSRAFSRAVDDSPWTRGGKRPGAGRKSNCTKGAPPTV